MTKLEQIANFLENLKILHKTGQADFDIFCNKCGGKNCRIVFFPDLWENANDNSEHNTTPEATKDEFRKMSIGIKCLDCGVAGARPYDTEENLYG